MQRFVTDTESDLIFHLEKALEKEEFEVYYQPIIHTISGSLCGFEALSRWRHPLYGILPPNAFISILEVYRQIYYSQFPEEKEAVGNEA